MEERRVWKNRFLTLCLTLFFATPILAPLASADGMTTCDGLGLEAIVTITIRVMMAHRSSKIGYVVRTISIFKIQQPFT